ncbi:cell wall-binding repeat-containing protein [Mesobacillus subterraneus]|uniref:cell wall-binding repeat-containing protein n=1 Tax=Mesobacillus subterraneus TaxID=285983 RepID=UPI0020406EA1|nr:cell wall-binding repeat-containing protein [Mesobacillus subterraneus]MCM3663699.1 cell wall-binding repeat-containing protein [Mesobacillus subterraneus]MCM3683464.1 cell wall-binding repeat-containing protein [Mesobacillus subterraneus]
MMKYETNTSRDSILNSFIKREIEDNIFLISTEFERFEVPFLILLFLGIHFKKNVRLIIYYGGKIVKRSILFLVAIVLLSASSFSRPALANYGFAEKPLNLQNDEDFQLVNEKEPNDYFTEANSISLEDEVTGTMSSSDRDMYKITIPKRGGFLLYGAMLETFTSVNGEISIVIYKEHSDGTREHLPEVRSSFDDEGGFYAEAILEPGTYYLQLTDNYDTTRGEQYRFTTMIREPGIDRISGKDRYETAVNVAYEGWYGSGADEILLATGTDFPDALAAAPLAYYLDAPILLTTKNSLPNSVIRAIHDLGVEKVTIIGGTGVVSQAIEAYLKNTLGITVERIAGSTRYETAVQIAKKLPLQDTSIVVSGQNYPDALSVGSYAAISGTPILLTEANKLPVSTTAEAKKYKNTFVIGGTGAVSENVFKQLPDPVRISGQNRYETSANVSKYFFSAGIDSSFVTTGTNFADALSGSVLAGFYKEPIVLTTPKTLHPAAKALFGDEQVLWYTIIGGPGAVSLDIEDELWSLIQ